MHAQTLLWSSGKSSMSVDTNLHGLWIDLQATEAVKTF